MARRIAWIFLTTLSILTSLLGHTTAVGAKPPQRTVQRRGTPAPSKSPRPSSEKKQSAAASAGEFHPQPLARSGWTHRVDVVMQVGGHLLVDDQGDARKVPMSVVAEMGYDERFLESPSGEDAPRRAIRFYDKAEAVIKIDKSAFKPRLGERSRFVVAEAAGDQVTLFCHDGPLTREELDLIDIPGTSLLFDALLPPHAVRTGQSWQPPEKQLAALLRLDAVSQCDVQCMLGSLEADQARIVVGGTVHGALEGTALELEIKGVCQCRLSPLGVASLDLAIKEKRSVGHAGPGVDTTARIAVRYEPLPVCESLDGRPIDDKAVEASANALWLAYEPPAGSFRVLYDRRWYVTQDESRVCSMRLIDRGDLIAQCQISPLAPVAEDRQIDLEQFQKEVRYSLGKRFGQFEQARSWDDSLGRKVHAVVVGGEVDGLPIEWHYYLIAGSDGQRLALSFTVEKSLLDRLGDADRKLVDAVEFR